jgi:hypothetical protein
MDRRHRRWKFFESRLSLAAYYFGWNYRNKGTLSDIAGIFLTWVVGILLVSWWENEREARNDPTVANIVYELNQCRDAVGKCLQEKGREVFSGHGNIIGVLEKYANPTKCYDNGNRYALYRRDNVLWVGCNLRQWRELSYLDFLRPSFWWRFIAGHPADKLGIKNCSRLKRRAWEIDLYGSANLNAPPLGREVFFQPKDNVVWMRIPIHEAV